MGTRKEKAAARFYPVGEEAGVRLVMIPPDVWQRFKWPDYQRRPNLNKVTQIAQGLLTGYVPGPVTVYQKNGDLNLVDGGHRVMAYMQNLEKEGIRQDIMALLYEDGTIDENETFVAENTKLRMSPANIINANNRSTCCGLIRSLAGYVFKGCDSVHSYPVGPLTIIKAGIILNTRGEDLSINRAAYLSVAKAIDELDALIRQDKRCWFNTAELLMYISSLWGNDGRHLLNFGVLGFAYFLVKNRPRFFTDAGLAIKTTRTRVSPDLGQYESKDRSDFTKLAALKSRWEDLGDQLYINASRDPVIVAKEINRWFWSYRKKSSRIWIPE